MASIFDDLAPKSATNQLADTDFHFYDADTLVDKEGSRFRIQGVDALEVGRYDHEGKEVRGEIGGELTTEQAVKLANDLGFDRVVKTGKKDETGSREVVDLQDAAGRSFRRQLAASGLTQADARFDPGHHLGDSAAFRRALRTTEGYQPDEWDTAAELLKEEIDKEQIYQDQFKTTRDFVRSDVDEKGNAKDSLSVAWDTGMIGVSEAAWGMASLLGESLGIEGLEVAGEAGVRRARARIQDQGSILTDYKDVDGFSTAVDYIANNALLSLPYLGITAVSSLAAPFTGGLSLAAPAAIYTGQTWNEMGDHIKDTDKQRSASIAIASGVAQATLDRLGFAGIISKAAPDKMYKDAVAELVKNGATKEAAEAAVAQASKRELASLLGDIGDVAKKQLEAKQLVLRGAKRLGQGAGTEATTEALQESIAAIGADLGSGSEIDWLDVRDRAIQGAVAGGTLGGAFTVPGSALEAGQWANIAWGVDREDPEGVSRSARFAREEESNLGYVPTIQELAADTRARPDSIETLADRAARHKTKQKNRSSREFIVDAMTSLPSLWRGSTRWIFNPEIQSKSRAARVLADMFGGNLQRIFGGSNFENSKHHRVAVYKNMIDIPQKVYAALNNGKQPSRQQKLEISQKFYETARNAVDKDGNFNPDLIPDSPQKAQYVQLINQLQALSDKMYQDQSQYNPDLGYQKNYLLKFQALDKYQVKRNRSKFIEALKSEYGLDEKTAQDLVDNILNTESSTADEAFSVIKGGPRPGSHKGRTLNLSENALFQEFMEKDIFSNVSQAAKSAARYTANQEFIGDNAKHINKLLDQMIQDGVSQQEVDKVAAQLQNYLDAESGNFHRPDTELGRTLQAVQKNFMLFTTLAGLPLATISSFVEAALTMRGLTREQIYGKDGGISHFGKELANTLWNGMKEIAHAEGTTGLKAPDATPQTAGKQIIRNLGFYDWDVGAATTTGVTETHAWHQNIMEKYFKWTGLQGWTNFTRSVRGAMAGDFIASNLEVILAHDPTAPMTNEVREAQDKLRNLGLDVSERGLTQLQEAFKGTADPQTEQIVADLMREAQFNFVNEAVALPQSGNRPLIYQDPRFALFTQFQGFIATFTANHIPRLWGEYVKRGSPAMRYNTFALMATMIALGFASQYLKDLIKYGGENPYLDDAELLQRGVRASGLLGTSERVLDQFFPLYETRSKDAGEWLFNTGTGESPSLSNAKRLVGAGGAAIQGDGERALYQGLKSAPILGPFTELNKGIADWAFDGGN